MTRRRHPAGHDEEHGQPRRRFISAHRLLFPAAIVFAVVIVPLWLFQYFGQNVPGTIGGAPGTPIWHAHEMIFGYAFAVVGGYLMTRVTPPILAVVFVLWLLGRAAPFMPDLPPYLALAFDIAYPVALFAVAGLPFLRGAKTGRNAVFAPLIAGLSFSAIIADSSAPFGDMRHGIYLGINLLTLLLFVMGGRVIAAATSGAMRRKGHPPMSVAQAGFERLGLMAIVVLTVCDLIDAQIVVGIAAIAAGAVTVVRLVRWRWHRHFDDPEMVALYAGYGWLAIGFFLRGAASLHSGLPQADAIHAFTIGALGTLTMVMMGRASLQRACRPPQFPPSAYVAIALLSAAALLRLAVHTAVPGIRTWGNDMLIGSGLCWSVSFLIFGLFVARVLLQERETSTGPDEISPGP